MQNAGFLMVRLICNDMSRLMGKLTICIGENKDADQLRGNREADQRLYFRYMDSIIPLLSVTAKLISAFVLDYADCWFSHGAAQLLFIKIWINFC